MQPAVWATYLISQHKALLNSILGRNILATFASKRVNSMETLNFVILQVFETAPWFKHCLSSYFNIYRLVS